MNNYCTKCGEKINESDVVCPNCNTPVVNLYNSEKNKKTSMKKFSIIGFFLLATFLYFSALGIYKLTFSADYKRICKKEIEKELKKYDVESWNIKSQKVCTVCGGGCDGACFPVKVDNCYEFQTFIQVDKNNTIEETFVVSDKKIDESKFEKLKHEIEKITIKKQLSSYNHTAEYINNEYIIDIKSGLEDALNSGILDNLNNITNEIKLNLKIGFSDNYEMYYNYGGFFIVSYNHKKYFQGKYGNFSTQEIIEQIYKNKDSNGKS